MGLDLNTALISDTFDGLIKTQDGNVLTATPTPIGDGRGNDSSLALATAGNGVTITGTLLVDGANIGTGLSTAQADIIAIEAKTDYITVTGAINLDTIKTKADFITVTQAVDLDTIESDIAVATAKTNFITVTQNVDLDTMESDILSAKTKTDFISISQAVNLDTVESGLATAQSDITAIEAKTDYITISSALNLNTVASNASSAKTKTDFLTVTQAVDLDTLESDVNVAKGDITAIETKTDFITVTQAVNLDTVESDIASAKTKTDFITVTQAVNLDTIESGLATAQSDINSIEGKTDFITITQPVDLDTVEANTATALANANDAKAKTDFITITQAVNLDTVESGLAQAQTDINQIEGKTDFITVTQAVNLDTMESDIATNNAKNSYPAGDATKVGFISVTQAVDLDSMETDISNLSSNKYDKTGGTISGNVTVTGDLTVNGTTTTVNTQTLSVEDPLIELANQNSANSVDTGFYANYSLDAGVTTKYAGLFKDAGDSDKFKLFKGLEVEPTTTVDTAGTGYTKGDLVVGDLDAVTISGDLTGTVTATSVLADGVTATTQSSGDNSTKVATTAYVDAVVTAQDLDFAGGIGTGSVDLDSQTFTIAGTANEIETSASGQTITIGLPSSVTVGTLTATTLGGTLSTAAQTNITSVGTLSSLTVSGALNGTISTAAQPNITSVGTLSSLDVSGNLTVDTNTLYVDAATNQVRIGNATSGYGLFSVRNGSSYFQNNNGDGIRIFNAERGVSPSFMSMPTGSASIAAIGEGLALPLAIGTFSLADLILGTNNTERLRIDGYGNIGIGTSSPSFNLDVRGTANVQGTATAQFFLQSNSGGYSSSINVGGTGNGLGYTTGELYIANSSNVITFNTKTSSGESMRIDSSGNVGIGTSNPTTPLYVVGAMKSETGLYFNNTDVNGAFVWQEANAPLRFATNDTERMRITSGGNLGIGESNPSSKLSIGGVQGSTLGSNVALLVGNTGAGGAVGNLFQIGLHYNPAGSIASSVIGSVITSSTGFTKSDIFFATRDVTTDTAPTERMRITSGGYLKASNNGTYVGVANAWHEINANHSGDPTLIVHGNNGSYGGFGVQSRINRTSSGGNYSFFSAFDSAASVTRFVVHDDGDVENINNAYGALSDVKLKENIADASPKLDDLLKVKVRSYNLIENGFKQIGVIAQELEEVFPSMVNEKPDFEEREVVDEDGNVTTEKVDLGTTTKSVKYSVFVPMLIKAMQEQQEIINDLKARIETLENK